MRVQAKRWWKEPPCTAKACFAKVQDKGEGEREQMAGLRFCSTCNNLLEPSEDSMRKRLIFKCGTCQATEVSDSTLVYKRSLKKKAETRLKLDKAVVLDPALPRTFDANCSRCKGKEAVFFKAESTSRDSDMALVFMCVRCKVSVFVSSWRGELTLDASAAFMAKLNPCLSTSCCAISSSCPAAS